MLFITLYFDVIVMSNLAPFQGDRFGVTWTQG
jgi:hypothetical protein